MAHLAACPWILGASLLIAPFSALGLPPPPSALVKLGDAGPTPVKVRRIGQVQISDTPAPPPAVALAGTHRLLVVLVETGDAPWPAGFEKSRYEELLFARSAASMREYFRENSYGVFDLTGEVVGPLRVPGRMDDYAFFMGEKNDRVLRLISAAVKQAAGDRSIASFDTHDARGRLGADGVIDHVMVIYAEREGAREAFLPIWPHRGTSDIDLGSLRVNGYTVIGHRAPLGVFAHEMAHDLGLPDLYDRDHTSHGVGEWCLMAEGSWTGGGAKPAHLSAWAKSKLGWLVPTVIAKTGKGLRVPSSSERPFALKLPIGSVGSPEYFLIENRRRVGFDVGLPAEGIVVWHIDERRADNDDEKHRLLDVIEAAPVQDLDFIEQGRLPNAAIDVFAQGRKDLFDDDSTPSAKTHAGEPSGIRMRVRSGAERVMTVDLERPEIFNPGGVPFTLERDGYNFGRFAMVATEAGTEALMQLAATPGGFLVFAAEAFFAGKAGLRVNAMFRLYQDQGGEPGKRLLERSARVEIGDSGVAWVIAPLVDNPRGFRLAANQPVWVGVSVDSDDVWLTMNPSRTSHAARLRRRGQTQVSATVNLAKGPAPISDYVLRLSGFGFLEGLERPDPPAGPDDPLVAAARAADTRAETGDREGALTAYQGLLKEMQQAARRYEPWIPVVENAIGVTAYELGRFDLARERFEAALLRAVAAGDAAAEADILENLGETSFHAKDPRAARGFCDRSRRINERIARADRLVENEYWLGRTFQLEQGGDARAAREHFDRAEKAAERAYGKVPAELEAWRARLTKARAGTPEDPDRVPERSEERVERGRSDPKQRVRYRDLMQFLDEDTKAPAPRSANKP